MQELKGYVQGAGLDKLAGTKTAVSLAKLLRIAAKSKKQNIPLPEHLNSQLNRKSHLALSGIKQHTENADFKQKYRQYMIGSIMRKFHITSNRDKVIAQIKTFGYDFQKIKEQMGAENWASNGAINYARNYTKQLSRDPASGFTKNMQPNIYKSIFKKMTVTNALGSTNFKRPPTIKLYPTSLDNVVNQHALFHEIGHTVDPSFRCVQDSTLLNKYLAAVKRKHFDKRLESYADIFGGNMLVRYRDQMFRHVMGKGLPKEKYQTLDEFIKFKHKEYGGSARFGIKTTVPSDYLFGIDDPRVNTKKFMDLFSELKKEPTLRELM